MLAPSFYYYFKKSRLQKKATIKTFKQNKMAP